MDTFIVTWWNTAISLVKVTYQVVEKPIHYVQVQEYYTMSSLLFLGEGIEDVMKFTSTSWVRLAHFKQQLVRVVSIVVSLQGEHQTRMTTSLEVISYILRQVSKLEARELSSFNKQLM